MVTTFNDTPRDWDGWLDDTTDTRETRIAWRDWDNRTQRPARWSKVHETRDGGDTTLCGAKVPAESYDTDPHGNGDYCKRCVQLAKSAR